MATQPKSIPSNAGVRDDDLELVPQIAISSRCRPGFFRKYSHSASMSGDILRDRPLSS
jgi:hypothetical protein